MKSDSQHFKSITAERIDEERVQLEWKLFERPSQISVYQSFSTDRSDLTTVVENTGGDQIIVEGQSKMQRRYYLLVPESGSGTWVSERRVPMEGTVNFRDMGGYQSEDGRRIKWGEIYRGDSLQRATDKDLELVRSLKIGEVYDFRREEEVKKGPNRFPEAYDLVYHHLPVVHGEFNFIAAMEKLKENSSDWIREETIVQGYVDNTVNFATSWGNVINRLAMDDCPPLYFHCTAGKDRTGICAALILSALNIPVETIMSDYLLSNPYIKDVWVRVEKMIQSQGINPDKLKPFFSAPRIALEAMLSHLQSEFGGVLPFLRTKADVSQKNIDNLKKRLLE